MRRFGVHHSGQGVLFGGAALPQKLMRNKGDRTSQAHTALVIAAIALCDRHPGLVARAEITPVRERRCGPNDQRAARRGWFDITGCLADGRFFGGEAKIPPDGLSADQRERGELVRRCGGVWIVFTRVEELLEGLRAAVTPDDVSDSPVGAPPAPVAPTPRR